MTPTIRSAMSPKCQAISGAGISPSGSNQLATPMPISRIA
jgi:hypothetical protein